MSTGAIIAIIVVAVVLVALIAFVARRRRLEGRRTEAAELRGEAQARQVRAEHLRDAADQEERFAREHHERALEVDPDTENEPAER
jgi:flagellar biosynthesis/type III secretory pathway M-ring protein FliF/YscJ